MDIETQLRAKYGNKKILVVGLGLLGGGVGIAKFFSKLGSIVTVTDKKDETQLKPSIDELRELDVRFTLGRHDPRDFLSADVIFKGPFVPWDLPEILKAQKNKIPIEMEMSFFASYCPAKIIGITGTRGKSTTTQMIYTLLKNSGIACHLAGNIPHLSTIQLLPKIQRDDTVVMELASWPLSGFHHNKLSPQLAVFTNFYPDHLNYYKTMDDYFYDKTAIFAYQKKEDILICNSNLKEKLSKMLPASRVIYFSENDFPEKLIYLKGKHNRENAAAAYQAAQQLRLDNKSSIKVLSEFRTIPYRLQTVAQTEAFTFVNDTTSTTPVATAKAIQAYEKEKVVLILGGMDKNLPFDELLSQLDYVESIVLLKGSFTDRLLSQIEKHYVKKITPVFDSLERAVYEAVKIAENIHNKHPSQKVVILFSPGATSFAMFNNEFHRGDMFNEIVKRLIKDHETS